LAELLQHQEMAKPFPSPTGPGGVDAQCHLSNLVSAFAAADDVGACREVNGMLRLAIELARDRLGLERAGLYMRDRGCPRIVLRGTFGTGARGETTDERTLYHEMEQRDLSALLDSRLSGGLGMYTAHSRLFAHEPGRVTVIGEGWIVATPLIAGRELVGVMYNDAAFTGTAVDEGKQAAAAVFSTLLGVLYQSRRRGIIWQPLPSVSGQSSLVERILRTLEEDLPITGERLAGELGVSAGHLARAFKREMGVSLVDYRNRKRLDRFFEVVQRMGQTSNLLDAALEAGFGSYAQFHRVYRKFLGTTPRAMFSAGSSGDAATLLGRLGPLGAVGAHPVREPEPD
jgi:AraC-like DNA-binding protein